MSFFSLSPHRHSGFVFARVQLGCHFLVKPSDGRHTVVTAGNLLFPAPIQGHFQ